MHAGSPVTGNREIPYRRELNPFQDRKRKRLQPVQAGAIAAPVNRYNKERDKVLILS
jgi:hypothetical protein